MPASPPRPRAAVGSLAFLAAFALAHAVAACGGGGGSGDGGGGTSAGRPGHAPTSASAAIVTSADTPSAPVTPTVVDPDPADAHAFTIVEQPGRGAAAVVGNQLGYVPDPAFAGTDAFVFRATDPGGLWIEAVATVTVTPVNHPPQASGGGRALHAGASGARIPWVDDPDPWDVHTVAVVTQPASGTVTLSAGADRWIYAPDALTSGAVSFTFQVLDAAGASTTGTAKVRVYDDAALATCRGVGAVNPDGTLARRGRSNPCAFYSSTVTRRTAAGTAVTADTFTHRPPDGSEPKALLVLIGGANFDMGIAGDPSGVASPSGGGNFLVRSAQRFADAGYVTVAMHRPSDVTDADVDVYRFSPRHAVDILRLARRAGPELDLFLVGTSRASLSIVSQNLLASGISLSSPVTARGTSVSPYYVDEAQAEAVLRPSFVARPAHVMWNDTDQCNLTPPARTRALAAALGAATTGMNGGVQVTTPSPGVVPDVCAGLAYHGYLGIEPEAVASITAWLDGRVAILARDGNRRPEVAWVTVPTAAGAAKRVDLGKLARDPDGDPLAFTLPFAASALGGRVTLSGGVATYTPPPGLSVATDDFVWVVTDGHGHVAAAVVSVKIGS